jgi:hypothetical protein
MEETELLYIIKLGLSSVEFEVLTAVVMKSTAFWDMKSCSPWLCLPPAFTRVYCLAYSSALKIETICSSETSDFQRTTRQYIPEDSTYPSG